jgi:uncharacterized protein (DUF2141 family)
MLLHTLLVLGIALTTSRITDPPKLIVEVVGIEEARGTILIGIYDNEKTFPKTGKSFRNVSVPVDGKRVKCTIDDLPEGSYAIALCHDVNGDGEFNTNFVGMPLEPYGFSNDVKATFKAPAFEDARFDLRGQKSLRIELQR